MNLTNTDCVGQDELCKVVSPKNSETPKQDIEICKTGDYKEPGHIESNNFTPNVRIGEPKVSADKVQNTNYSALHILMLMVNVTVSYFALLEKT